MPDSPRLKELDALREAALTELDALQDDAALEAWRIAYLGRSGKLTQILRGMSSLPAEERPAVGAAGNKTKAALEERLAARRGAFENARLDTLAADSIDISLPGRPVALGRLHPSTLIVREITEIFRGMGFQIVEGPRSSGTTTTSRR
jgi:phenylalanyl-tRNA synthetase alpha chain